MIREIKDLYVDNLNKLKTEPKKNKFKTEPKKKQLPHLEKTLSQ